MFSIELLFHEMFFFLVCSLPTTCMLPNFIHKQAQSWTNKKIYAMFIAWKDKNPSVPWWMLYLLQILFLVKIKPTNVLNGAAFLWDFFLRTSGIAIFSVMQCFMCNQMWNWKNKIFRSMLVAFNFTNISMVSTLLNCCGKIFTIGNHGQLK